MSRMKLLIEIFINAKGKFMSAQIFGNVFDIQHFSLGDGPGIRTTVFLKGCPLRCEWCHNPESLEFGIQIMYHHHKCTGCGLCITACPNNCHKVLDGNHIFNSTDCNRCKRCVDVCCFGAIETVGKIVTVSEVMSAIEEDMAFYESSQGGMTLSGGEPMCQPDFSIALAKSAKERGIHVCMETSGFCNSKKLQEILPYIDMFLFDYKATGDVHKQFTGVSNDKILENLFMIDSLGAKIVLRCPVIPDRNLNDEHIVGIINVAKKLINLEEINLEPYHNIGVGKRKALGMIGETEQHTQPTGEIMQNMAEKIENEVQVKTVVM